MVEYFIGKQHFIYIIIIFFNKYLLAIAGQMAKPNWLKIFGGTLLKKFNYFYFQGQCQALSVVF